MKIAAITTLIISILMSIYPLILGFFALTLGPGSLLGEWLECLFSPYSNWEDKSLALGVVLLLAAPVASLVCIVRKFYTAATICNSAVILLLIIGTIWMY